jgi:predicted ATPase
MEAAPRERRDGVPAMLTALRIQNFKSWLDTGEIQFAPITGFFGANSSGKSSILQFLLLLKQTVESPDRAQVLNFGGDARWPVDLGSFREVVHRRASLLGHTRIGELALGGEQPTSPAVLARPRPLDALEWSLEWTVPQRLLAPKYPIASNRMPIKDRIRFEASVSDIGDAEHPRISVDHFAYVLTPTDEFGLPWRFGMQRRPKGGDAYDAISPKGSVRGSLPPPHKFYRFPIGPQLQFMEYMNKVELDYDHDFLLEIILGSILYLGPLRDEPQRQYTWAGGDPSDVGRRGEQTVAALLASRQLDAEISPADAPLPPSLEQTVAHWLKELRLVHDFGVVQIAPGVDLYRVVVQQVPSGTYVPLTEVGFGVSQILPVLTLCYYAPPGSILILEQPELHLHPAVQSGLADMLIDAVKSRGVQIILESHSEHLLARLQRRIAEDVLPATDTALYFCEMQDTGASKLTPLTLDEYGNITNWPAGFFGDEMGDRVAMMEAEIERRQRSAGV